MRDRDRHCPKCQGHKREAWIAARQHELLPCTYFHVVFTLPMELNPLALHQPGLVYKSLFEAAWQTLNQFGNSEGLQLGMISILHTWGQNLSLHPHLSRPFRDVVPGGGVDAQGHWQRKKRNKNFLFPVKALSTVFRAKYTQCLREGGIADQALFNELFSKNWVVYAKRPFGSPAQVIEYLGRYTHKVAISNHRIREVTNEHVSFSCKDYRNGGSPKGMQLTNGEFIRRFAQSRTCGITLSFCAYPALWHTKQHLEAGPVTVPANQPLYKATSTSSGKNLATQMPLLQNRYADNDRNI